MAKNHLFTGGILRVAEELGNALERLRALEIERKHQVIPLETAKAAQDATLQALNAAIAGIQAMDFQTLSARTDKQVAELEAKIEARRAEIGQAKAEADGQIASHREHIDKLSVETRQKNDALSECVIALSGAVKEVRAELAKKIASARSEIERADAERALEIVGRVDSLRDELSARHTELAAQVSAVVEKIDAKGALNPAGVYVAGTKYNRGDVVTLNGSSYVSLVDGNAEKPSKSAKKWQLLAARGGVIAGGVAESGRGSSLPDQVGNSGKFLTTDGTNPSWATLAGGGDLLAANNLSDVAVAATAFANIKQAATETATGVVELATSAETTAGLAVQASDTRLSDARTPTAHAASHTDGTDDIQDATAAQKGLATAAQITKLDGIEAGADVTDAGNVAAAGAVMSGGALGTPASGTLTNTTDYPVATTSRTGATPQATAPAAGLLSVLAIANGEMVRTDKAIFDTTNPAALGSAGPGTATVAARRDHVHAMPSAADVGALPVAGGTMTGNITQGENSAIVLDPALSADGKYCGIVEGGTAGAALAFGDLCYFAVADSRWELTDADAAATAGPVKLGICVLAASADGDPTTMLLWGKVRADSVFPTLTVGAPVYVGLTAGDVAVTETWGTDDVIRVIGYGNTADELFFCPSRDYITYV